MTNVDERQWSARTQAALRIVAGVLFLAHGLVLLFGYPVGAKPGAQPLMSFMGVGGAIELIGGMLVVAGLFTRPTALVLSGQMAVAYFLFHGSKSIHPTLNGGDASILFCFIFLHLAVAGSGAWSLDRRLAGLRSAN